MAMAELVALKCKNEATGKVWDILKDEKPTAVEGELITISEMQLKNVGAQEEELFYKIYVNDKVVKEERSDTKIPVEDSWSTSPISLGNMPNTDMTVKVTVGHYAYFY